jgi:hypothetical protein
LYPSQAACKVYKQLRWREQADIAVEIKGEISGMQAAIVSHGFTDS